MEIVFSVGSAPRLYNKYPGPAKSDHDMARLSCVIRRQNNGNETKWLLEFIYHFYPTDGFPGRKGETAVAGRKGNPHNHVDLPPLVPIEATGICIPICSSEVLLAAVHKSPGHIWNDRDIRHKSLQADLNDKYPYWNSVVSNFSGSKLLNLRHIN
jgi:hypothetical protein